jgi:hypothetical protein
MTTSCAYRGLVIEGPVVGLNPAEVEVVEREVGAPLPAAYRAFLEVVNGGSR